MARPDQHTTTTTTTTEKPGMMEQVKEKVQHAFGSDDKSGSTDKGSTMQEKMEQFKEKVQHVFGNDQGDTGSADQTQGSMQETMAPGGGTQSNSLDDKVIKHTK